MPENYHKTPESEQPEMDQMPDELSGLTLRELQESEEEAKEELGLAEELEEAVAKTDVGWNLGESLFGLKEKLTAGLAALREKLQEPEKHEKYQVTPEDERLAQESMTDDQKKLTEGIEVYSKVFNLYQSFEDLEKKRHGRSLGHNDNLVLLKEQAERELIALERELKNRAEAGKTE